jgi:hypothetical protein
MRGTRLWSSLIAPIVTGVTVGIVLLAAVPTYHRLFPGSPTRTAIHYFAPTDGLNLADGLRVSRTVKGDCSLGGSKSDFAVHETHRCYSKNLILDPCWDKTTFVTVVCVASPWSSTATVVRVRWWLYNLPGPKFQPRRWSYRADPNLRSFPTGLEVGHPRPALSRAAPWALELVNGDRCVIAGGASGEVASQPISYLCDHGFLVGYVDRRRQPWVIGYLRSRTSRVDKVAVAASWN